LNAKPSRLSQVTGWLTLGWSNSPSGRTALRRTLVALARTAMHLRSRNLSLDLPASVLVVAPHPDDEALGCGGAVAMLAGAGAPVHIVFVTDGSASHPTHPTLSPRDIALMRKSEAREATAALGVASENVIFLEGPDGQIATLGADGTDKMASRIASLLGQLTPDAILLPGRRDGSTDHESVFKIVRLAMQRSDRQPRVLEFPIWAWRNPILLMRPVLTSRSVRRLDIRLELGAKVRAIDAYASQVRPLPPETDALLSSSFIAEFKHSDEYFFET
jgi:LmbE family N-acetylglucosaminyl deacetylase